MKKLAIIFLLFIGAMNVHAQSDTSFEFIKTIKGRFSYFNVDNLDNVYLVNSSNQLKKLNANGDSAGIFNDVKRYGNPSSMDVTNPLKILLYYKNYSTVVVLDRFLNQRNSINLRKQNIFAVKTVATSYDNNIWLFDEQNYTLKKIDETGKPVQETADLRIVTKEAPAAEKIIDHNNFVYLYDAEHGFYIFDYYGAYKNKLPFAGWSNVAASNNTLYGFKNGKLESYQINSLLLKEYSLPAFFGKYTAIQAMNGKVYLLKKDGIDIYKVK